MQRWGLSSTAVGSRFMSLSSPVRASESETPFDGALLAQYAEDKRGHVDARPCSQARVVTLCRPSALNAVNLAMIQQLDRILAVCV